MSPAACTICCVCGVFRTESYQATFTPRSCVSTARTTWLALTLIVARSWRLFEPLQPEDAAPPSRPIEIPPESPASICDSLERSSDSSRCQETRKAHPANAQTVRPVHEAFPDRQTLWLRCVKPQRSTAVLHGTTARSDGRDPSDSGNDPRCDDESMHGPESTVTRQNHEMGIVQRFIPRNHTDVTDCIQNFSNSDHRRT